jgi:ribosomal-protein-alanine N-acetyltransferase
MKLYLSHATVRQWRLSDAPTLTRHANNPRVARNLRDAFPHPYTIVDAHRFLEAVAAQNPETFFCIAVDDEPVGGIGFTLHDDVERYSAEIGYWLSERHWGRGIVSEALAAVTRYAMDTHELHRVYAAPYAWNVASARVLQKAGYVFEGRLRCSAFKEGRLVDQLLYAYTTADRAGHGEAGCGDGNAPRSKS